jgi:serine/threonine protein phosphatase PrpC
MSEEGPGSDREVRVHVFGRTDVGQIREHNEDTSSWPT